ncbi:hypothetical protein FSP39_003082 [Pinctada imbricata]|uniref:Uncharacterized protein n=1 Tax=Pinctada imbricata TaxID=66713 RepID=A0AA89BLE5_PINIB|nr:hypothetical protein FSP39_003082 [Pinctada imbricata]
MSSINIIIVGAGPVGLMSALLTLQNRGVAELVIFEERKRTDIFNLSYQVSFDAKSVQFLTECTVDFDNIEGCWMDGTFTAKVGVFLEYVLDRIMTSSKATVLFSNKFDRQEFDNMATSEGRHLLIVCDGRNGQTFRGLGFHNFCKEYPCGAYGAIAAIKRPEQRDIPTPEKRVHNLTFDLSAYGYHLSETNGFPGFSLKIFGNSKHRFLSIAVTKSDSNVVKTLRSVLDRSMMRNVFLKCFNVFKAVTEQSISDSYALHHMEFSPRLFEIKLSQRCETVAYFDDCDTFVLAEGEAALSFNFHTGLDINPHIRCLMSLGAFIDKLTAADSENSILESMVFKIKDLEMVCKELVKKGLKEAMFSTR